MTRLQKSAWTWLWCCAFLLTPLLAQSQDTGPASPGWHYGGFLDLGYAVDSNFPENHLSRSKLTTPRVNELAPNMALAYVKKNISLSSPWGMELGVQAGYDTDGQVPQTIPERDKPISGADTLRHLSRANLSYLVPMGKGLVVTAGLFNSYIGYESIYAKYNMNYTRPYMADYVPYFMFGLRVRYPVSDTVNVGFYAVNGYHYLSHINDHLSYGTQVAWKLRPDVTFTQNLYYGPEQANTSFEFWRFFSNSILEWQRKPVLLAIAYDIGTENAAEQAGHPRTFWTSAAFYARWNVRGPWSVALRPEVYWDRNGRMTGSEQLLKAITTTLEYQFVKEWTSALMRLEYRYDDSTGPGGGFYKGGEIAPGVIGLTQAQQLVILSLICAFDK